VFRHDIHIFPFFGAAVVCQHEGHMTPSGERSQIGIKIQVSELPAALEYDENGGNWMVCVRYG
jgi:hypothetical protein